MTDGSPVVPTDGPPAGEAERDGDIDDDTRTVRLRRSHELLPDEPDVDADGSTVVVRRESKRRAEAAAAAAAEHDEPDAATVLSRARRARVADAEPGSAATVPSEQPPVVYPRRVIESSVVPRVPATPRVLQTPVDTAELEAARRRRARRRVGIAVAAASLIIAVSVVALVILLTTS